MNYNSNRYYRLSDYYADKMNIGLDKYQKKYTNGGNNEKAKRSMEKILENMRKGMDYLDKADVMDEKLKDIKSGKIQAGRDYFIQTDFDLYPFWIVKTDKIIEVKKK